MPEPVAVQEIRPITAPFDAVVTVPGSKSLTARALVAAALASGTSRLENCLSADDTAHMVDSLQLLGIDIQTATAPLAWTVGGCGGQLPSRGVSLDVGLAGTAARFLPPLVALGEGTFTIDGNERMRERPMAPLLEALRQLGARITDLGRAGHLPIRIEAHGLEGGRVSLPGHISSQLVSGLLLSGPYMRTGLVVEMETPLVSRPYVDLTLATMAAFGVTVEADDHQRFVVPPGAGYEATDYQVEPDASAASYFFAAAAITASRVRVEGLGSGSLQGDLRFVDILEEMGAEVRVASDFVEVTGPDALEGVDVDMADLSDTAQTLAVVAPFAKSPTRIRGIGFIRTKETDRIGALVAELARCGIRAEEHDNGLVVFPGSPSPARVSTYGDHRMAMSFAVLGLRCPGIEISDPGCVAKTFPDFFAALDRLRTA